MVRKRKLHYKKISLVLAACLLPGGFIALGAYFYYKNKNKEKTNNKGGNHA